MINLTQVVAFAPRSAAYTVNLISKIDPTLKRIKYIYLNVIFHYLFKNVSKCDFCEHAKMSI